MLTNVAPFFRLLRNPPEQLLVIILVDSRDDHIVGAVGEGSVEIIDRSFRPKLQGLQVQQAGLGCDTDDLSDSQLREDTVWDHEIRQDRATVLTHHRDDRLRSSKACNIGGDVLDVTPGLRCNRWSGRRRSSNIAGADA
jgi:hypothetical protein